MPLRDVHERLAAALAAEGLLRPDEDAPSDDDAHADASAVLVALSSQPRMYRTGSDGDKAGEGWARQRTSSAPSLQRRASDPAQPHPPGLPGAGQPAQLPTASSADFDAAIRTAVAAELARLLPDLAGSLAPLLAERPQPPSSDLADLRSQLSSLRADLATVYATGVRDDDILASRVDHLAGRLAALEARFGTAAPAMQQGGKRTSGSRSRSPAPRAPVPAPPIAVTLPRPPAPASAPATAPLPAFFAVPAPMGQRSASAPSSVPVSGFVQFPRPLLVHDAPGCGGLQAPAGRK